MSKDTHYMASFDGMEVAGASDIMSHLAGREFASNLHTTASASLDAANNVPDISAQLSGPALV